MAAMSKWIPVRTAVTLAQPRLTLGLALIAAVGLTSSCRQGDHTKTAVDAVAPRPVQTVKAEFKPMERTVVVAGSFHAREQSTLSVKVPGRLESIAVDIGSVVRKGDVLAQIDRGDYQLRLKQAEAVLVQARALVGLPPDGEDDTVDLEKTGLIRQAKALLEEATKNRDRVAQLTDEKIVAQAELDTVRAAYTVAASKYQDALEEVRGRHALVLQRRAELNLTRKQLTDSTVRAPFDGVVHQRLANLGEFVQTGAPLLVIAAVDPLRLRLEVPERESTRVQPGQTVRITVGGSSNVYTAEITRVSPILSEANRMLLVEADVPPAPELRPGLFAHAEIIVSKDDRALAVPESSVTTFVGLEKLFVLKEGKAVERNITTGRRSESFVEVRSGVVAGEKVILNPEKLRSQQPVVEESHAKAR